MNNLGLVEKFLNRDDIVSFIEDEDLDNVYRVLVSETLIDVEELTNYLLQLDIDPLEFLTAIPNEMFYRVYRDIPTELDIPLNITRIGREAFYKCTSLIKVTIPESVKRIGYGAFKGCTGLKKLIIKNANIAFEEYIFTKCPDVVVQVPKDAACIDYLLANNVKYVEV